MIKLKACLCIFISASILICCNTTPGNTGKIETVTGFIPVANSKLYYEITGKGEPVLLLHGGLLDRRMWEQQVKALSTNYQVITCDQRGHGLTVDGDSNYLMHEAVRILLDSLHISNVTIGGLSMGAMVATDFAINYPDYTKKLILVTPGLNGNPDDSTMDSVMLNRFASLRNAIEAQHDSAMGSEIFIRSWFDGPQRKSSETDTIQRKKALEMCYHTITAHRLLYGVRFADIPSIKNLSTIKMPVLVINTDKDNPKITRNVDTFLKAMPQARHVLIKNTAHMPNMEKPEEFNKAVLDFLAEKGK
jgi:3-oxoadipate enol-lactonase